MLLKLIYNLNLKVPRNESTWHILGSQYIRSIINTYVPQSCHFSGGAIEFSMIMVKAIPMKNLQNIKPFQSLKYSLANAGKLN